MNSKTELEVLDIYLDQLVYCQFFRHSSSNKGEWNEREKADAFHKVTTVEKSDDWNYPLYKIIHDSLPINLFKLNVMIQR